MCVVHTIKPSPTGHRASVVPCCVAMDYGRIETTPTEGARVPRGFVLCPAPVCDTRRWGVGTEHTNMIIEDNMHAAQQGAHSDTVNVEQRSDADARVYAHCTALTSQIESKIDHDSESHAARERAEGETHLRNEDYCTPVLGGVDSPEIPMHSAYSIDLKPAQQNSFYGTKE